ncbi:UNVERIFIED_CONTAM: hypothetical protein Slati_0434300 [Sesamum latifolium]|uniref:Zinc knuckle CX2CX4HX4C domain-containing protein n=1 Tax=Sesamum latifolium TaxID=2727402 RepID=A0AAW2XZ90_9LAMI
MEFKQLSEGSILLHFFHVIDKKRAVEGCPWSFDRNILILNEIRCEENSMNVDLNWCNFYVHIHALPLNRMNLVIETHIGNKLGIFRDMEIDDTRRNWGGAPHSESAWLQREQSAETSIKNLDHYGDEITVFFKYERLPNFCYFCGRLGHIAKYWEARFAEEFVDPGDKTPYGSWLHAPLPPRSNMTISSSTNSSALPKPKIRMLLRGGAAIFGGFNLHEGEGSQVYGTNDESPPIQVDYMKKAGDKQRIGQDDDCIPPMNQEFISEVEESLLPNQDIGNEDCRQINFVDKGHSGIKGGKRAIHQQNIRDTCQTQMLLDTELLNVPLQFTTMSTNGRRGRARRGRPKRQMARKRRRFVAVWRKDVDVWIQSFSVHRIDATVKMDEQTKRWSFTGFYGHLDIRKRRETWNLLWHLSHQSTRPWLCVGTLTKSCTIMRKKGETKERNGKLRSSGNAYQTLSFTI